MATKPTRTRRLWKIGELTGAEAAMDAGAAVDEDRWNGDHYDADGNVVCLTPKTHDGRELADIFYAIHEAMHFRQWRENAAEARIYQIGTKTRYAWLSGAAMGIYAVIQREWWWAGISAILMFAVGLFKWAVILNLEHKTWEKAIEWMKQNYEISYEDELELLFLAKQGIGYYLKMEGKG